MNRNILLVLLILLKNVDFVQSQIKDIGIPYIKNYSKDTYQSGTQNWDIVRGSNGFMYFANNNGVLEFDGSTWQIYKVKNSSIVRSIAVGNDNNIYVGSSGDIGYLKRLDNGKIIYQSLIDLIPQKERDFDEVWKVFQTDFGIVFQSYNSVFIYQDNRIKVLKPISKFEFSFYVNNQYYIVDKDHGIFYYKNGTLQPLIKNISELFKDEIRFIIPYLGNRLLIGTFNHGIFLFDGKKLDSWNTNVNKQLLIKRLYSGIQLRDNYYAFGSIQDGVFISDQDGNIVQHINRNKGLQNNTILSLYSDPSKNLWLGLDNGISFIEISSPITFFNFYHGTETGYASIVKDDILYLGTNQGLFCKNLNNKIGADEPFKIIDGTQGQVWSLTIINGKLICGHNSGTYIIEGERIKNISEINGGWTYIQPFEDKTKIIGGTYKGLILFEKDLQTESWKFSKIIKGFNISSKTILEDNDKSYWISHEYKGIYRVVLNASFDSVKSVTLFSKSDGLPEKLPYYISKVDNQIIVTTEKGIYTYDPNIRKFAQSSMYNSFFRINTNLRQIRVDNKGNRWYFGNNCMGVYRLLEDGSYKEIYIPFLRYNNSMISSYENLNLYDNKNIIIGSVDGFIHYNSTITKNYSEPINVCIREVHILKDRTDSILSYNGNYGNKDQINKINISYKYNSLLFRFSSPFFEDPEKTEYRCILKGRDKYFSPWVARNIKEYTNLREGTYEFEVQARNIYQNESTIGTFKFKIEPPFYKLKIAYFFYILIIALTIFYISKRISNSNRKERLLLKRKLIVREQQFKEETLMAEKEIEHLKNETLVNEMKHKNKELANSTMHLIQKNKFLTSVKNEIANILNSNIDENNKASLNKIVKRIDKDINNEKFWNVFDSYFDEVHQIFLSRMKEKHPDLSPKELRLSAYLRMNISTKEIATLMNISVRGVEVSRYRLRRKLNIDRDTNLTEYILKF